MLRFDNVVLNEYYYYYYIEFHSCVNLVHDLCSLYDCNFDGCYSSDCVVCVVYIQTMYANVLVVLFFYLFYLVVALVANRGIISTCFLFRNYVTYRYNLNMF